MTIYRQANIAPIADKVLLQMYVRQCLRLAISHSYVHSDFHPDQRMMKLWEGYYSVGIPPSQAVRCWFKPLH